MDASPMLRVDDYACDGARIAIPRPEIQLVVRCGATADGGLDVHASGAREHVHRKFIRGGQWAVTARLRLGTSEAVLGAPASVLAGRIVALEELWGNAASRRLRDRLASARSAEDAAGILQRAITERSTAAAAHERPAHARLALAAADRLASANVNAVAADLGVSERHLRRVFRETVGLSPKTFAKLTRFHRALHLAREDARWSWANIAASAGYYDQAHLIADFHAIADATPRALLEELRAASPVHRV